MAVGSVPFAPVAIKSLKFHTNSIPLLGQLQTLSGAKCIYPYVGFRWPVLIYMGLVGALLLMEALTCLTPRFAVAFDRWDNLVLAGDTQAMCHTARALQGFRGVQRKFVIPSHNNIHAYRCTNLIPNKSCIGCIASIYIYFLLLCLRFIVKIK